MWFDVNNFYLGLRMHHRYKKIICLYEHLEICYVSNRKLGI